MLEVNVLRQVIEPLASILTEQSIQVRFEGKGAETLYDLKTGKPVSIRLPMLSSNTDPDIVATFHGYLDHEMGHVLYSEIQNLDKLAKLDVYLFNIVEDVRIEREMCEKFRGSVYNLSYLYTKVFDKKWEAGILSSNRRLLILMAGLIATSRSLGGQEHFTKIIERHPEFQKVRDKVVEGCGDKAFLTLRNSQDALELAQKIKTLFDFTPDDKDKENGEGEEDGVSMGDSDKQKGNSQSDGNKEGGSAEKAMEEAYQDHINKALKQLTEGLPPDPYTVPTTDYDIIEHVKTFKEDNRGDRIGEKTGADYVAQMEFKVGDMTATLQKNLERVVAANKLAVWASGKRNGRLHSSSLYRLLFDDDRIFKQRANAQARNAAISLVIDMSGSMMRSGKIDLAIVSAYALSSVLTNMNIPHEVIGMTTKYGKPIAGCHPLEKDTTYHSSWMGKWNYSRVDPLYLPIFKSFADKFDRDTKERFCQAYLKRVRMLSSVDGESIQICAERLMRRPEPKKIMIVMSDGEGQALGDVEAQAIHLKETIETLEKKIGIVGLGIMSKHVKKYYKHYVVINDIKELPTVVIKKLKDYLV